MAPSITSYNPVVMLSSRRYGNAIVQSKDIQAIVAHRSSPSQTEEYLVQWRWKGNKASAPYSWHPLHELAGADGLNNKSTHSCLPLLQIYLESLQSQPQPQLQPQITLLNPSRKRKSPEFNDVPRLSPFDRSRAGSSSSSRSEVSLGARDDYDTYNCDLEVDNGFIYMVPRTRLNINTSNFPTEAMKQQSQDPRSRTNSAASKIRSQFIRSLQSIRGQRVNLKNNRDLSTPSLGFNFIDGYLRREGVPPPDNSTMIGCGLVHVKSAQTCRPNMGGSCGCEYTRSCECLEYALIDFQRLNPEERAEWESREQEFQDDVMGLPKRFPYSKENGLLKKYYLDQRWPIYECNDMCACGPDCKNRLVQKGRTVGLEIFRTKNRGWGLRATEHLPKGKFIDIYQGEIITRAEADRRADVSKKGKDSYLFPMDKFPGEHLYEIDGEFFGGPSRFINHSCDPNCVVYVVMFNKNEPRQYEIAFFAFRDIQAGEELTFNYRDHEGLEDEKQEDREGTDENLEEDSIPCLCGAANCKKWLWK